MSGKLNLPDNAIRVHDKLEIWKIPGFATDKECEELIQEAYKRGFQVSEVDDPGNSVTKARTSETSFMSETQSPTGKNLGKKAQDIVGGHQLEGIQVQRYEKGQKYNPHYDTFDGKDGAEQRNWTAMLYLNNVEKGGGTYFPKVDLRIFPEKGTLVVWNNLDSQQCREQNSLHTGEPVEEGKKYVSTWWYRKGSSKSTMCPMPNGFGRRSGNKTDKVPTIIEKFNNLSDGNKCGIIIGIIIIVLLAILLIYLAVCKSF